jgi:glycosyltransferase involved in cell wall biosynthesis
LTERADPTRIAKTLPERLQNPHVVHVVVAGDIGGAERFLVDLATRPSQTGVEHSVALMTPNPKLADLLRCAGLRLHDRGRVRENPVAYLWRSLGPADVRWLVDVLRTEHASLAHLHTFASHVIGTRAAAALSIPVVRTEHHTQYFVDLSTSMFTRWSLKRADAVVAISQYVRDFVADTAPYVIDRMVVVRNGVDADYFAMRPNVAEDSRPFRFVVVCRLEPWKGVDLVIEALVTVPEARLDVVGDGSERARLAQLAQELGVGDRVRFLGYESDPRAALAQGDVAINSSLDEPLGLSVLEALATGRPVLAFAGGGIPEVVVDGETGWLVYERSAGALAGRMRQAALSRGRAVEMGRRGRGFVDSECRIETMCDGYRRVYERLLHQGDETEPPKARESM